MSRVAESNKITRIHQLCSLETTWWKKKNRFQREGSVAHQPLLVSELQSDCHFVRYQNIRSALFGFVTKHVCDRRTDGQADRITAANIALA